MKTSRYVVSIRLPAVEKARPCSAESKVAMA